MTPCMINKSETVTVHKSEGTQIRVWAGKRERETLFTTSEHNKYIYKLDNSRLPERNNHHSWPPMIIEKNNH